MAVDLSAFHSVWPACMVGSGLLMAGLAGRHLRRGRRLVRDTAVLERDNAILRAEIDTLRASASNRDQAGIPSGGKTRFLATVSHEIRTPLGGILGLADLLAGTPLTREQQSYIAAVRTSGSALMTLIDDILDYSKVEAGRLDLVQTGFDINELVESVVELLAPRAQDKGLEIATRIAGTVPGRLIGDPHRLRQVLLNLAGNAVKFTETGGVGIEVGRREDGFIQFSVSDTGPGVPQDRRVAIFEEFEQADGSASRRHGGTGLGLAIATTLVGVMGGEIRLTDREGGGSVFSFAVPLSPESNPISFTRPAAGTRRALIVSPTEFQPAFLAEALRERKIDALRAGSRREAEELLRCFGSLIEDLFVDCGLGEANVRALAAEADRVGVARRILLFSPFERRAFGEAASADYDAWLVKPVRERSLSERLTGARPPEAAPSAHPPGKTQRRTLRVLLAEDDPVNALVARASLERLGAEVVHAEDGHAAWSEAEASLLRPDNRFDVVLMDVCMPVLDGIEVTRRIRAAEARLGLAPVNIVATTADVSNEARRDCEQVGMDDVIIKPIRLEDLQRMVQPTERLLASA